jgi:hypothetical protein
MEESFLNVETEKGLAFAIIFLSEVALVIMRDVPSNNFLKKEQHQLSRSRYRC